MSMRALVSFVAAMALGSALAACSGDGSGPGIAPLAKATLTTAGLGDVRVGATKLGEFVDRFGAGRVDLIASDDTAYELVHAGGQLAFLFPLGPAQVKVDADVLRGGQRDLPGLLAKEPGFRELVLSSLTIAAPAGGDSRESCFFQGKLDGSVALLDPLDEAYVAFGVPSEERPPLVAGASPDLPEKRLHFPRRGVVIYATATGSGATPDLGRVVRITLYVPGKS